MVGRRQSSWRYLVTRSNPAMTRCVCCQLQVPARVDQFGLSARACRICEGHQGESLEKRLARAEAHERMLREWIATCRASEAKARSELAEAQERVRAALQSRSRLASRIVDADAATRDSHRCAARSLADDPQVKKWDRRNRVHEDDYDW